MHIASGDQWAGAEVQLFTLARSLHSIPEITVEVILLNHGRLEAELKSADIKVTVIDEEDLNGFKILQRLIDIIRHSNADVIHTHRLKENILGSIAAMFCGNIPSLRTSHGATEHRPSWHQLAKRLILYMDWLCGRFMQKKIVAVSSDLASILQNYFPEKHITVIENGIDINSVLTQSGPEIEHDKSATLKIGIAGRLVPIKRVDLFIETAHHLKQTLPEMNADFYIFGDGPLHDELVKLSKTLQTEDIVHFKGHSSDIHSELKKLDLLLMTSDHEGLPMILLEAMVLSTPIISHAVGGIPELLEQGKCGRLVEQHNAQGYAEQIRLLIDDVDARNIIARRAAQRVRDLYSAERNARNYFTEYKKLAAR
jgi:glycosyltransferase involved in cell wall biosynthesis